MKMLTATLVTIQFSLFSPFAGHEQSGGPHQ